MKYRKKPVVIEAFQYQAGMSNFPQWAIDKIDLAVSRRNDYIVIETLEGDLRANPGDWIIKRIRGELYPCKDDIFRATYDEVAG